MQRVGLSLLGWLGSLGLLAALTGVARGQTTPVFTYYGTVRLPDGSPFPAAGHSVQISTRNLGQLLLAPVGEHGAGTYSSTVVELLTNRAAVAGDSVRIALLDPANVQVGAAERFQLSDADITAQRVRTDLSVVRIDFLLTAPVPRSGRLGIPEVHIFTLRNHSNVSDSYDVLATSDHAVINSFPAVVDTVAPNDSVEIPVTVTIPDSSDRFLVAAIMVRGCSRLRPSNCQAAATTTRPRPVDPVDVAPSGAGNWLLHQNVPNPFNPATRIAFDIPETAAISLQILDTRGRVVRTLLDQRVLAPGHHVRAWDGLDQRSRPVSSGVYHYRLVAPSRTLAGRMVLLR